VTSGLINYDYASISEGVNHMRQINNNIRDQVSNLRREVQNLRGAFTGAASDSYDTCSQKIAQDLTTSNQQLDTLAGKVNTGANNFQDRDRGESRRFQS
jgi:WXG100 family type VII secretion target